MSDSTLEPTGPEEAVRLYLRDRRTDLAEETIESYRYKLTRFIEWCKQEDVDNLNELSGRSLLEFKQSRSEDLNPVSLKGQLDTLRAFIRFCESIDAVETDLHNKVLSPTLNQGDRERDVLVDPETATDVLQHLSRFDSSLHHTLLTLLWRCGARSGTIRAFDVEDYDRENQWLRAVYRPGTPLKNKRKGERLISLSSDVCRIVSDYIDHRREEVWDDAGRNPLLTTQFGRVSKSTIRETCFRYTNPCEHNGGHCGRGEGSLRDLSHSDRLDGHIQCLRKRGALLSEVTGRNSR
jgi:site-specific recombinase XerD